MPLPEPTPGAPPGRTMRHVLVGSAVLAVAAAGLFAYAVSRPPSGPAEAVTVVEVGAGTCRPSELTVPAGRTTFEIVNTADRPLEWEILDGVMVLEERENILPGYRARLAARLDAGTYDITCGLLTGPRGKLTVTPVERPAGARVELPLRVFIAALSEWRVVAARQSAALVAATRTLATTVASGDVAAARAAYVEARRPYKAIEAVMDRYADLEATIDPQAEMLAGRDADPAFVGFRRIERGLVTGDGLGALAVVAGRLADDAAALQTRLKTLKLQPADLARLPERQARRLADGLAVSLEPALAGNEAADLTAAVDGLVQSAALLGPIVAPVDAAVARTLDERLAGVGAALPPLIAAPADPAARRMLAAALVALADTLAGVNPALGLE